MYPLRKLTQAVPDGCMRFFLSRYLQKKANTPRRARKKAHFTTGQLLYIIGSYGLGRKPISPLCTRPFRQVTTALHLPSLPTPATFHAVASHSLLVPRNFMPFTATQQQIFPRASSYQLLRPFHFPAMQEYEPVSYLFTSQFYK